MLVCTPLIRGNLSKNTGKYGYKMEFLEASKTELVAPFLYLP